MAANDDGLDFEDDDAPAPAPKRRGDYDPYPPRERKRKKQRPPKGLGATLLKPALGVGAALVAFAVCGGLGYAVVNSLFGGPDLIPPEYWHEQTLDGRFKVSLPGTPTVNSQAVGEGLTMRMFSVELDKFTYYAAAHTEGSLPPERAAMTAEQLLDDSCDGSFLMLQAMDPRVREVSRTSVTLDGHPGKQLVVRVPAAGGQMVSRVYTRDGRLFMVTVIAKGMSAGNANAKYLFDSMKSVPESDREVKPGVAAAPAPPKPTAGVAAAAPPAPVASGRPKRVRPPLPPEPPVIDPTLPIVASTLELKFPSPPDSGVHDFRFSPDGQTLIASAWDDRAYWFEAATGRLLGSAVAPARRFDKVAFTLSPLADRAAFQPEAGGLAFLVQGQESATIMPAKRLVNNALEKVDWVAFSHDGASVYAKGAYQTGAVWDVRSGLKRGEFAREKSEDISADLAAFSPDGELLVTAGAKVIVWDAKSFRRLGILNNEKMYRIDSLAFSPDSRSIVAANNLGCLVWDLERDGEAETVVASYRKSDSLENAAPLRYSPDGKYLVNDWREAGKRSLRFLDAKTLKVRGNLDFTGLKLDLSGYSFRPTDSTLAVCCGTKILFLDLAQQHCLK